jgi:hypothetical protein
MRPVYFRNKNFAALQIQLSRQQVDVYFAWRNHGPGTTRAVAAAAGFSLLSFRPRSTELLQLGALCLADEQPCPREGCYRARPHAEWRAWQEARRQETLEKQLNLIYSGPF